MVNMQKCFFIDGCTAMVWYEIQQITDKADYKSFELVVWNNVKTGLDQKRQIWSIWKPSSGCLRWGEGLPISRPSVQEYWEKEDCSVCCCGGMGKSSVMLSSDYNPGLRDRCRTDGRGLGKSPSANPSFLKGFCLFGRPLLDQPRGWKY